MVIIINNALPLSQAAVCQGGQAAAPLPRVPQDYIYKHSHYILLLNNNYRC